MRTKRKMKKKHLKRNSLMKAVFIHFLDKNQRKKETENALN